MAGATRSRTEPVNQPKFLLLALAGFAAGFLPAVTDALRDRAEVRAQSPPDQATQSVSPGSVDSDDSESWPIGRKLEVANKLFRGSDLDVRAGEVTRLLDECARDWRGSDDLALLAGAAQRLPFSAAQLHAIARGMEKRLSIEDIADALLSWHGQAAAERLFLALSSDIRRQLAGMRGVISGLFGDGGANVCRPLWQDGPPPPPETVGQLLANGAVDAGSLRDILDRLLPGAPADTRARLLDGIVASWPSWSSRGGARASLSGHGGAPNPTEIWEMLCRSFHAPELSEHVSDIVRFGGGDQVFQIFGGAVAREESPVAAFLAEVDRRPTEPARRQILMGMLAEIPRLDAEQAELLKSGVDDFEMEGAIDRKVVEGSVQEYGPAALRTSNLDLQERTAIALDFDLIPKWPDEIVNLGLDGIIDMERLDVILRGEWGKSLPLSDATAARLGRWRETRGE